MTHTPLLSMSATTNDRPSGASRTSCGMALAPPARLIRGPAISSAIAGDVAPGEAMPVRSTTLTRWVTSASTTISWPLNSHLATRTVRSAVKSAWLIPPHGSGSVRTRAMVVASLTTMAWSRSAMPRAYLAVRGEGQVVGVGDRDGSLGCPEAGSIGVMESPASLLTHSVLRSCQSTTCSGERPTRNLQITVYVAGSMTSTVPSTWFGTSTGVGPTWPVQPDRGGRCTCRAASVTWRLSTRGARVDSGR